MKHKISILYSWLIHSLLFFFPDHPLFMRFRGFLYSFAMKSVGKNFQVASSVRLISLEKMSVGDNVYIAHQSIFICNGEIIIGDEVLFGPNVVAVASAHQFDGSSYRFSKSNPHDIIVGSGCWIGANTTLVGELCIAEKCIIGAGSVASGFLDSPLGLYAGTPTRLIKIL